MNGKQYERESGISLEARTDGEITRFNSYNSSVAGVLCSTILPS